MKMPQSLDDSLLAPCGIYCMLCHHHCKSDTPCNGCYSGEGKSEHCQKCDILACAKEKKLRFCIDCNCFPCDKLIKFDDYYMKRFGRRFLKNALFMKEHGKAALLSALSAEFACTLCGGVVCIHDSICTECGKANGNAISAKEQK